MTTNLSFEFASNWITLALNQAMMAAPLEIALLVDTAALTAESSVADVLATELITGEGGYARIAMAYNGTTWISNAARSSITNATITGSGGGLQFDRVAIFQGGVLVGLSSQTELQSILNLATATFITDLIALKSNYVGVV